MNPALITFILGLLPSLGQFSDGSEDSENLQQIRRAHEKISQKYTDALSLTKSEKQREELLSAKRNEVRNCVRSALKLAVKHGADSRAFEALRWIVIGGPQYFPETLEALDRIQEHHITNKNLGLVCVHAKVFRSVYPNTAEFLRSVMQKNPDLQVQGLACFTLAQVLQVYAGLAKKLKDPAMAKPIEEDWPREIVEKLRRTDPERMIREAEQFYQQTIDKYADVKTPDGGTSLKLSAEACLFELRRLAVGMVAPDIDGLDLDRKKLRLTDYRGKVVVLEFWGHW